MRSSVILPSRRQAIRALGAAAFTGIPFGRHQGIFGQTACAVLGSPSLTEGPYFVDEELNRSDIRVDPSDNSVQDGVPLVLNLDIKKLVNCEEVPLTGAYIDIWHCNAAGVYSDVSAQNSVGKKFLRGYLPVDRRGRAQFLTVYPGWYQGRAVHIHSKIRIFDGENQTYEFTSQFFFDEDFTDTVYQASPYGGRGNRDTRNGNDGIYGGASSLGSITSNSGSYLMLDLSKKSDYVEASGKLICDLTLGSSPDQVPGGGGTGGPGGGTPPGGGMPPGGMPPATP